MNQHALAFWSFSATDMLQQLHATKEGLTSAEARQRLARYGSNLLKPRKRSDVVTLLLAQFKSPIILILLSATGLSFFLHAPVDAFIILIIVLVSGLLGFWQEHSATNAMEKLLAIVQINAAVRRDGGPKDIPVEEIVPGDIVILDAGDIIPGDCLVQESTHLFVDEAMLTGETFPVEKAGAVLSAETPLGQRTNVLWMGTHVVSGSATALVIGTGKATEFGKVSERHRLRPQETDFEHGIRQFGYFLMEVTLVLVVAIFAINVYLARPVLDSFLFSLALAVGLTPQLLPAIISINLAHGAKRMAQAKVIVKRLASNENFGSMNVICSDKTGTLTEGSVHVQSALDVEGAPSDQVLLYAYLNAFYETGFTNPIDEAIRTHRPFDLSAYRKADEIPYDFLRKRLSILVAYDETHLIVTKGALAYVLAVCASADAGGGTIVDIAAMRDRIQQHFEAFSHQGYRTLGVAYKKMGAESRESAVDVAKEAADIVLLEKDLGVLVQGVREGRRTFANTMKYVFMATSANFGNIFSMAGVSLFLPFLPLLPKQILLTNLLTDFPEMAIATDTVDNELVDSPRRWDIKAIRRFMMTFGPVSSVFDYLTFGALQFILHATPDQFRTGWFLESVISASLIVLVIRSRRPFFKSRPSPYLLTATLLVMVVTLMLPFTPFGEIFGLSQLPMAFLLLIGIIVIMYMITAEMAKAVFYQKVKF